MSTQNSTIEAIRAVRQFVGDDQFRAMRRGLNGEEGDHFRAKFIEYGERIQTMPKTYEQDGLGDQAIVYLHYFKGSMDWYITERDADPDGEGQIQAFGLADLGYGGELGYISIVELIENGVELDLYFTPATLAAIKIGRRAA